MSLSFSISMADYNRISSLANFRCLLSIISNKFLPIICSQRSYFKQKILELLVDWHHRMINSPIYCRYLKLLKHYVITLKPVKYLVYSSISIKNSIS